MKSLRAQLVTAVVITITVILLSVMGKAVTTFYSN